MYPKHKFNIFPEMQGDDYERLLADLELNGYDESQPIYLYQGAIIDGWNRQRACIETGLAPVYKEFIGSDVEAINFVMRTNKRRNLTSFQWACVAVEAEDIVRAIKEQVEEDRRRKQAETQAETKKGLSGKKLPHRNKDENKAVTKLAEAFNTNRTYINEAAKLKKEKPEVFEQAKTGAKARAEIKKEAKIEEKQKRETERKIAIESVKEDGFKIISDITPGWHKIGEQYLYFGSNMDKDFIDFLPESKMAFADPPYNAGVDEWDVDFTWRQDYLQDKSDIVAITPGGWNAYNFYRETSMNYQWEMCCWITNGMTHGRCGYANFIKVSIFGKVKAKIQQDFFKINIKPSETEDTKHKGRKPYPFMAHLIQIFTEPGDYIIDAFAGSGTTLLMAEKMNRVSYNAEMDKKYCIDIVNRSISNGMKYEQL